MSKMEPVAWSKRQLLHTTEKEREFEWRVGLRMSIRLYPLLLEAANDEEEGSKAGNIAQ